MQQLFLAAFACLLACLLGACAGGPSRPGWTYLDNGEVRIGVDRTRGAAIGYFALVEDGRNLLNHRDNGRFIQQSYYGDESKGPDGRPEYTWHGRPWLYNPIQGGSPDKSASALRVFEVGPAGTSLHAETEPRLWCDTPRNVPEASMRQWIELRGKVAHIRFSFAYDGPEHQTVLPQEVPAVFVDYELPNLVTYTGDAPWTGGALSRRVPGWPNEKNSMTENWFAYVDDQDWGIGVYTPGTEELTCYRFVGEHRTTGPDGGSCSYAAPLRRLRLRKGFALSYDVYVTIGDLESIRARFAAIARERAGAAAR